MNKTIKRIAGNWFDPYRSMGNVAMLLFSLLILTDGDIAIKASADSEATWLGVFSAMPDSFGWLLLWVCFDNLFTGGQITKFVLDLITQILSPVTKAIIGEERLAALQKRFKKAVEGKDEGKDANSR